jgi:DNA-3-methyladenine glycosylase
LLYVQYFFDIWHFQCAFAFDSYSSFKNASLFHGETARAQFDLTAICNFVKKSNAICKENMQKLSRSFYDRNTIIVAKELLGKYLVHKSRGVKRIGKIVEVEAYLGPHDLAAHSSKGLTERTRVMFGPPGHAYVYFIYGMYHCMNIVTEREGHASAVLLRAIEPMQNVEDRTQGPGLLCRAMRIDKRLNAHDLLSNNFFIAEPEEMELFSIVKRPRVGVDYAKHWAKRHLRFYIKDNPFVSPH